MPAQSKGSWEHFAHGADIGIRGTGTTKAVAFEQAALAMTAVITALSSVAAERLVEVECEAPDDELLFADWLNAIVYEMAIRKMLFSEFRVQLENHHLRGTLRGQTVDVRKHRPVVEVKGATYTELSVGQDAEGRWYAGCVLDV